MRPLKFFLTLGLSLIPFGSARAINITWQATPFTTTNILNETNLPNSTTIQFNIDTPGLVQVDITKVQNFGDTGTPVASLSQIFLATGPQFIPWNGLWLINGDFGRIDGNYQFALTLTTTPAGAPAPEVATAPPQSQLLQINSVDIHNVFVFPSFDTNGSATFPYFITYSLAKDSLVTATIANTTVPGTVVRTLFTKKSQFGERTISTNTITWDGLGDDSKPVTIGLYAVTLRASDPSSPNQSSPDLAIPRVSSITVQSLAGSAANPQKLFEDNAYVFPNPVRNGSATFQIEAVRDGANLSLRIYTMTGDLVREQKFSNVDGGTIVTFAWNAANQAGNKVGRGLYYFVVREEDPQGTLQTVKKMAVLP